jgi:hypothetical protein
LNCEARRQTPIQRTVGNGVVTTQNLDPLTDRLTSTPAGNGNAVESFSYIYDALGNVLTRADANENTRTSPRASPTTP